MHGVIASIKDFDKVFPNCPKEGVRREALTKYFAINGVIKATATEKDWPKISYPNNDVLNSKLKEVKEKQNIFSKKLGQWKSKHFSASTYHQVNQIKKLGEPLYWQHLAKVVIDPDYRKDANSVKLPAHLVSDKKWKPMVKMFVNDLEYRKQLTETVTTSIIYKDNQKVAQFADELQEFRMDASDKQVKDLQEKLAELAQTEKALREMQKWAKE
jgi:hypothetical protein